MKLQQLATETREYFVRHTRGDDVIWVRDDTAPDWVQEMCLKAHGDMLPDDWRYAFIVDALDTLSEYEYSDEARDSLEADLYTSNLTAWLASRADRYGYVVEAVEEWGHGYRDSNCESSGIIGDIQLGQWAERCEVFDAVYAFLTSRLEAE